MIYSGLSNEHSQLETELDSGLSAEYKRPWRSRQPPPSSSPVWILRLAGTMWRRRFLGHYKHSVTFGRARGVAASRAAWRGAPSGPGSRPVSDARERRRVQPQLPVGVA